MQIESAPKQRPDRAVKQSLSLPLSLLERAKSAAKKQGRTLSNYFQTLVRADCPATSPRKAKKKSSDILRLARRD